LWYNNIMVTKVERIKQTIKETKERRKKTLDLLFINSKYKIYQILKKKNLIEYF